MKVSQVIYEKYLQFYEKLNRYYMKISQVIIIGKFWNFYFYDNLSHYMKLLKSLL